MRIFNFLFGLGLRLLAAALRVVERAHEEPCEALRGFQRLRVVRRLVEAHQAPAEGRVVGEVEHLALVVRLRPVRDPTRERIARVRRQDPRGRPLRRRERRRVAARLVSRCSAP